MSANSTNPKLSGRALFWPLVLLAVAVLAIVAALQGCALFSPPLAYDENTVENVEQSIRWAAEDERITLEAVDRIAGAATDADRAYLVEAAKLSHGLRRKAHLTRLRAWLDAERAKTPVEGDAPTQPIQPRPPGEVWGAAEGVDL